MTRFGSLIGSLVAGIVALGAIASPGLAARIELAGPQSDVVLVQSDCYSIGEQVAAQYGGTLARAKSSTQGGQPVCVIVVLVPGKDGQQPRRTEVVVPQG